MKLNRLRNNANIFFSGGQTYLECGLPMGTVSAAMEIFGTLRQENSMTNVQPYGEVGRSYDPLGTISNKAAFYLMELGCTLFCRALALGRAHSGAVRAEP